MASSRDTSNSPDWRDLASIMDSFEKQESGNLKIGLTLEVFEGEPDFWVELTYTHWGDASAGLVPSASVRLRLSTTNRKTLDAALLAALYQLDFKLASLEYEENPKLRK